VTDDHSILDQIGELVAEEQRLREQRGEHTFDDASAQRLKVVEERLDQCWDLLRQRRGREEFGLSPDGTEVRPADVVENYEQ
jgi:hypothetical protein